MLTLFRRPRPDRDSRRALEAAMHAALRLGPHDTVRAAEIACPAPGCAPEGCADRVTTLLVLRAGFRTHLLRADKPLAEARPADFYQPDVEGGDGAAAPRRAHPAVHA